MTISEFLKKVLDQEVARKDIIAELDKLGDQISTLEDDINKALFAGIPELAAAVLKVAKEHYERGLFFSQVSRRIEEKVLFGDSKEALELLHHFEKDEIDVSTSIKNEFGLALEKLQLRGTSKKAEKKDEKGKKP
jgi:hypothetical protein